MAEETTETKISFPYMSAGQWFGIRAKLRQSVPKTIDVDWVMAALGTSEKGAKNVIPQLRAIGLMGQDGTPSPLALDLRDDDSYVSATKSILANLYPESLRDAYNDASVEPSKVASWFMRNAKTGELTASVQAKLYLTLLRGELPSGDEVKPTPARRKKEPAANSPRVRSDRKSASNLKVGQPSDVIDDNDVRGKADNEHNRTGPNLHIDLQIHISADAGEAQIEAVFKSMAKHLYGR